MDCGPTCIRMIARHYGRSFDIAFLRRMSKLSSRGTTFAGLADVAEKIGLSTMAVSTSFKELSTNIPLPCIAHWRQGHFVIVLACNSKNVEVADPAYGIMTYKADVFHKGWTSETDKNGTLMLFEPTPQFYDKGNKRSRK